MKWPLRRKRLDRWLAGTIDSATLLGLRDDDREELLFEAKRRFDAGDIGAAKRLYALAASCFAGSAEPWIGLGACAQMEGDLRLAMGHYRTALERSFHTFAVMNLAECQLLAGERDAARETISQLPRGEWTTYLSSTIRARIEALDELMSADQHEDAPGPADEMSPGSRTPAQVDYAVEPDLSEEEFRSVLVRSSLAERRPMDEEGVIAGMLRHAGVIVTARSADRLVGVSRAITDRHFCTYLSDLAVDRQFQKGGIGHELIRRTHEAAGLKTTLILLAAPLARAYYPHIGMTAHDSCWYFPRTPPSWDRPHIPDPPNQEPLR